MLFAFFWPSSGKHMTAVPHRHGDVSQTKQSAILKPLKKSMVMFYQGCSFVLAGLPDHRLRSTLGLIQMLSTVSILHAANGLMSTTFAQKLMLRVRSAVHEAIALMSMRWGLVLMSRWVSDVHAARLFQSVTSSHSQSSDVSDVRAGNAVSPLYPTSSTLRCRHSDSGEISRRLMQKPRLRVDSVVRVVRGVTSVMPW